MTHQSQAITRKSASNLALAFVLLPKPKRHAMSALYAFCREVDDVADEESVPVEKRRADLAAWRDDARRACEGGEPSFTVNRELQPIIAEYHLPFGYFDELIQGVEMDLDIKRYETFEDLELYCYRVASVVGLLSIEIFGYQDKKCRAYAIALGKALQLTNILRDVRNDAERGRIYLPLSELQRHKVSPEEILRSEYSDRYEKLAKTVAAKAKEFYAEAARVLPTEDRRSMVAAELMSSVYGRLLKKLERRRFDVFNGGRVRLGRAQKLALIWRAWWGRP
ncbi:MAG TPA: presqualene diphosphate synthase HpnD [Verrucomicrobiae bacterium]|jgi:phytoene synthase|nr:presqualene diphosphate synthase HpnD [Verrucomicrobiae bacterium]